MHNQLPGAPSGFDSPVDFGRDICGDLRAAERREWLVTNGIGGFASGTIPGILSRRYHGLLFAALKPPLGRTLIVAKLEEFAEYDGRRYALSTNRWVGGAIDPEGYRHIERFRLEGTIPTWTFACADALIEKQIWMEQGFDTTSVRYVLLRGSGPVKLTLHALVNYRDYHSTTHAGDWRMEITPVVRGLRVDAYRGANPFFVLSSSGTIEPAHVWYRNFDLSAERDRGLDDHEDHLHAGTVRVTLTTVESVTVVFSTETSPDLDGRAALARRKAHEETLLRSWHARSHAAQYAPTWIRQLVLAADQFVVSRPVAGDREGCSVIAGYPWFGDWGRDTMISLPGLTLATGRAEVARRILRTFVRYVDRGMLPNRFPDSGEAPEYNAVDATLWFFEAVRQYFASTQDMETLGELFPTLAEIIEWHIKGTRYNIKLDSFGGLLCAGEAGVQLTWMDAKVGEHVITARIGKAVEVNALWLNALAAMGQFARALKQPAAKFDSLAQRARAGFQRFWNPSTGYCFDVLDGPEGNEASLRPNQIFAVALAESPLSAERQRAVVDICARFLLTSFGLRSLALNDPRYRGQYRGGPRERDAAYHQGTAWGWLLGPFVRAHLRVYRDPAQAARFLEPMAHHLKARGLGSAGEIFDGDPPFTPRGCIAQAWTVGELLNAWQEIAEWGRQKATKLAK